MKISIFSSCGRNFRHTTQPRNPTLKELAPALQKCTFHHHLAQKSLSCADTPHSHTRTFAHGLDQRRARGVPSPCPEPPFSPFSLKKKITLKQQDSPNTLCPIQSPPAAQSCLPPSPGASFHQAAIPTIPHQEPAALKLQKMSLPNTSYSHKDTVSLPFTHLS